MSIAETELVVGVLVAYERRHCSVSQTELVVGVIVEYERRHCGRKPMGLVDSKICEQKERQSERMSQERMLFSIPRIVVTHVKRSRYQTRNNCKCDRYQIKATELNSNHLGR